MLLNWKMMGWTVKLGHDGKPTLKKQVCGDAFEGTNIYKKVNIIICLLPLVVVAMA